MGASESSRSYSTNVAQPFGKCRFQCVAALLFLHAFHLKQVLLHLILCASLWNKRSLHLAISPRDAHSSGASGKESTVRLLLTARAASLNALSEINRESSVVGYILRASHVGEVSRGVPFGRFSTYHFLGGGLVGWSERTSLGTPQIVIHGRTLWVVGKNIAWVILWSTRVCQSSKTPSRWAIIWSISA